MSAKNTKLENVSNQKWSWCCSVRKFQGQTYYTWKITSVCSNFLAFLVVWVCGLSWLLFISETVNVSVGSDNLFNHSSVHLDIKVYIVSLFKYFISLQRLRISNSFSRYSCHSFYFSQVKNWFWATSAYIIPQALFLPIFLCYMCMKYMIHYWKYLTWKL